MKALIAAGGRGTRLRPITHSMNKHLIPVANVPMIVHAILKVADAGVTDIAISINEGDTDFPAAIGDGSTWGVHITYIEQRGGALGLAHVVKNARAWLGDDKFIFYLGDNIILGSVKDFADAFEQSGANAYLALAEVEDPTRFGVAEINQDGEITRVLEKPDNPPSNFAVTGIYCYDSSIHEQIAQLTASERGELEISDAHTRLIATGGVVKYQIVDGWWKDTGTPQDLLAGNHLMLELADSHVPDQLPESVVITGKHVVIDPTARLTGEVQIIGPFNIAAGAVISDATVGPEVSIGKNTCITGATVTQSIIMDDAKISGDITVRDSIVGHGASINRTNRDGSSYIIGENSQITL